MYKPDPFGVSIAWFKPTTPSTAYADGPTPQTRATIATTRCPRHIPAFAHFMIVPRDDIEPPLHLTTLPLLREPLDETFDLCARPNCAVSEQALRQGGPPHDL